MNPMNLDPGEAWESGNGLEGLVELLGAAFVLYVLVSAVRVLWLLASDAIQELREIRALSPDDRRELYLTRARKAKMELLDHPHRLEVLQARKSSMREEAISKERRSARRLQRTVARIERRHGHADIVQDLENALMQLDLTLDRARTSEVRYFENELRDLRDPELEFMRPILEDMKSEALERLADDNRPVSDVETELLNRRERLLDAYNSLKNGC